VLLDLRRTVYVPGLRVSGRVRLANGRIASLALRAGGRRLRLRGGQIDGARVSRARLTTSRVTIAASLTSGARGC
jgi:hypothetical protein